METPPPSTGRCFEDFEVGAVHRHWPGRTIGEADNAWFTLLTMNTHPLHFDAHYAAGTRFGRPLVNSAAGVGGGRMTWPDAPPGGTA